MIRSVRGAVLSCVAGLVAGAGVAAETTLDLPVMSDYMFRGLNVNDEAVLQPYLSTSSENGFSFGTWANVDLTDNGPLGSGDVSEIDIIPAYSFEAADFGVTVGVAMYFYPDQEVEHTEELFVTLGHAALPFGTTLSVYYDVDAADGGMYASLAGGHDFAISEATALNLGVSVGYSSSDYNMFYLGADVDGFNDVNVGLTLSHTFTETVSVSLNVQFSALIDSDIEEAAEGIYFNDGETVYGGATYSWAF